MYKWRIVAVCVKAVLREPQTHKVVLEAFLGDELQSPMRVAFLWSLVCVPGHSVGFLRVSAIRNTQTVYIHRAFDITSQLLGLGDGDRASHHPMFLHFAESHAPDAHKRRSTDAEAEAPRPRPTETGGQELVHLVVKRATDSTGCLGNFVNTTCLGNYHVSHTKAASISAPLSESASDSLPGEGTMRNLVLNLLYLHELGNRTGELRVCSSMLRASEACNFAHMIVPGERDWVLEAVVSTVGLDAAPTGGRIELDFGRL